MAHRIEYHVTVESVFLSIGLSLLSSVMRLSRISQIVVKSLSHRRLAAQWRNIISITIGPCRKSEPYPRSYRHVEGRGS